MLPRAISLAPQALWPGCHSVVEYLANVQDPGFDAQSCKRKRNETAVENMNPEGIDLYVLTCQCVCV